MLGIKTLDWQFKFIFVKRLVTAERAKILSVTQNVGESIDDFLALLREEARYCDF